MIREQFTPKIHHDVVPRLAFKVDSARVNHYDDVIDHMVQAEIRRCIEKDNFTPTPGQIAAYRREMVRLMTIGRQIDKAQKVHITPIQVLNETE